MGSVAAVLNSRSSGILLPVFSLPSNYGIGELGPAALRWLDFLHSCGQKIWQILPLNPAGFANSPYQSSSSMAGNSLLIGLEGLLEDGLLEKSDFDGFPPGGGNRVDYDRITKPRNILLRRAAGRFLADGGTRDYEIFCAQEKPWLDDHALFCALSQRFATADWISWPSEFRDRRESALISAEKDLVEEIATERVLQYFFQRQWSALRRRASQLSISIVGDMPIFLSHSSVDLWKNRELFHLDGNGNPMAVAGVPPDYFSATGQRWGNPLYRWDKHRETSYAWWICRMARAISQFDALRVDHFRAFADYWEIPASEPTAVHGRWVDGPGEDFFRALEDKLGPLPIIAEDLGILSEKAIALRDRLALPGLRIFLFALDDYHGGSPFLPENFIENCVAYTGTHDNATAFESLFGPGEESSKRLALLKKILPPKYSGAHPIDGAIAWLASSRARWVIFPMQDLLHLGSEARMNKPATVVGNWSWRLDNGQMESLDRQFLLSIAKR
ncbi:MAG: 4-alpha-glucanotransferase [Puniceicoccales bacterium]|jgi:4-alpha-glucanotransferase|nr:4-alpha-glucanotransferase [Puniceicoccales bacterium]